MPCARDSAPSGVQYAIKDGQAPAAAEGRAAITWVQRRTRIFGIDAEICRVCSTAVRIMPRIEDPNVTEKSLTHPDAKKVEPEAAAQWSNAGVDGYDQAIQSAESPFILSPLGGRATATCLEEHRCSRWRPWLAR
jgi:hypothetical protein